MQPCAKGFSGASGPESTMWIDCGSAAMALTRRGWVRYIKEFLTSWALVVVRRACSGPMQSKSSTSVCGVVYTQEGKAHLRGSPPAVRPLFYLFRAPAAPRRYPAQFQLTSQSSMPKSDVPRVCQDSCIDGCGEIWISMVELLFKGGGAGDARNNGRRKLESDVLRAFARTV
jgi:hypothetical protein